MDQMSMTFDGQSVDLIEGKFVGAFEDTASNIDDEHYILVRVRNKGAAISETKSGDLKRVNNYAISEAVKVDTKEALRLSAAKNIQLAIPGGLDLGDDDEEDEIII